MIRVYLLSRRDPAGEWCIRSRYGIHSNRKSIDTAKELALRSIVSWQRAEPFTEFKVVEE